MLISVLEENMEIPDTELDSPIPLQREGSTDATMTDSVLVTAAKDNIKSQIAYGPCFSHTLHQGSLLSTSVFAYLISFHE
jgi:hypothetical protein